MKKEELLNEKLLYMSLFELNKTELIAIDGGDVTEFTQSVLEWCGRTGGHIANMWDTYKKAMIEKAEKEHHWL